jgi:hypothetical protein
LAAPDIVVARLKANTMRKSFQSSIEDLSAGEAAIFWLWPPPQPPYSTA